MTDCRGAADLVSCIGPSHWDAGWLLGFTKHSQVNIHSFTLDARMLNANIATGLDIPLGCCNVGLVVVLGVRSVVASPAWCSGSHDHWLILFTVNLNG
jgi:hypothetical protein